MAHYSTWGDTQQWDEFATLLHEDAEFIIDAAPRATPDADPVIKINGRDNYVNGMIDYTNGFHTAHQMYLPDITIIDEDTAHATWCLHDYVKTPVVNFKGWGTCPRLRQGRRGTGRSTSCTPPEPSSRRNGCRPQYRLVSYRHRAGGGHAFGPRGDHGKTERIAAVAMPFVNPSTPRLQLDRTRNGE